MIRFACPACHVQHQAPDHAAGKKTRCPSCRQVMRLPVPIAAAVSAPAPIITVARPREPTPGPSVADITRGVWNTIHLLIALAVLGTLIAGAVLIYANWEALTRKVEALRSGEPIPIEIQLKN